MEWEIVMGLEVHVELATKTKIQSSRFTGGHTAYTCGKAVVYKICFFKLCYYKIFHIVFFS